jgi:hypothetical protein
MMAGWIWSEWLSKLVVRELGDVDVPCILHALAHIGD